MTISPKKELNMEAIRVDSEPQRSTWTKDRAKKARIQKAAEAKLKKITSQADADDKAAEEAHNQWALHDNLARADPALYGKGLQGLSRAEKSWNVSALSVRTRKRLRGFARSRWRT